MMILPIHTKIFKEGDHFAGEILKNVTLENGDIVVISSKAIATVEGAGIDLSKIKPSEEAKKLSQSCNQDPRFTQAILDETKRMNGAIDRTCPYAMLTSLKPENMKVGRILCPNAGLDQSNIAEGFAIGWPRDPVASVRRLQKEMLGWKPKKPRSPKSPRNSSSSSVSSVSSDSSTSLSASLTYCKPAIILSDSCCRPGRLGVTAFALCCCGIDPMRSEVGTKDLFGKTMRVTQEAVADQLATAANAVMGNANQCCPAAIIRDFAFKPSDFCGWVDGIEPGEDLFG
jgi:coenzyme F420-0:L-glutamate ligase / coenzyme F420-1:gamma-L-glutamate ligase